MVKLMNNQFVWESQTYTHTNSNSPTQYSLPHNFGKAPDLVVCYVRSGALWNEVDRSFNSSGSWYGYSVNYTASSLNTSIADAFKISGESGTCTIKFKCFSLGTTQTITNITPAFQWSTSEQVYPFEKNRNGDTLYCKEVDFGALPNNGHKQVAHNISGLTIAKIFKYEFYWSHSTIFISTSNSYTSRYMQPQVNATYVVVDDDDNVSTYNGLFRLVYAK